MIMTTGEVQMTAARPALHGAFIVTGAASGLGLAIAKAIGGAGGSPIAFDVNAPAEALEHEVVDVSDREAVTQAISSIAEKHGGLSGIVANAGVDACGRFLDVGADAWERVIRVNLIGTANVVRAALPYLIPSRGRVVTVASTLGLRAVSDATAYCASKFGVVGFTRALATELAGEVPVTLLIPGGMHTHFFDGRDEKYKPAADAKLNRPEDVAQTVVFALSQPPGCEIREMLVCPSTETSWP
ncbi:MAG TPA: SDR family oxidoreductase [Candidatus Baltobacteraceae bacterium]|nr:SDR family oxidoreductase [Candidatus Baltobacteraceae bacterium]